jgi:hypothetical protein
LEDPWEGKFSTSLRQAAALLAGVSGRE